MSLEDLGNIGEFVAAVAVVISLIYLAVQIRQNTATVRASTHQSIVREGRELHSLVVPNDTVAHIVFAGLQDWSDLSPEEQFRLHLTTRSFFAFYEDTYLQMRRNVLDPDTWRSRRTMLVELLDQPGARRWWKRHCGEYPTAFQEEVQRVLSALPQSEPGGK